MNAATTPKRESGTAADAERGKQKLSDKGIASPIVSGNRGVEPVADRRL
jgi:hypothetical protein